MSWLLTQQLISLFIMMGAGFALVKLGYVRTEDTRTVSAITVYIVTPCALFGAFQIEWSDAVRDGLILATVGALVSHCVLFALASAMRRALGYDEVEAASTIYSNSANLLMPLVLSVLGREWVVFTSGYVCVQNIFLWTHGRSLMDPSGGADVGKILKSPNIWAIVIGLVMLCTGIKAPRIIAVTANSVGAMIGPINMILIGMLFAGADLRRMLSSVRVWGVAAVKMIVQPLIFIPIFAFSPLKDLAPDGGRVLLVTLLAVSAPCATTVTQMAVLYGRRPEHASALNVVSTLMCVVTMPLSVMAYLALS